METILVIATSFGFTDLSQSKATIQDRSSVVLYRDRSLFTFFLSFCNTVSERTDSVKAVMGIMLILNGVRNLVLISRQDC